MKKSNILSIILAVLTVAALIFGIVTNGQKIDLQKQVDELKDSVATLTSDIDTAKTKAAADVKSVEDAAAQAAADAEKTIADLQAQATQAAADAEAALAAFQSQAEEDTAKAVADALADAEKTIADLQAQATQAAADAEDALAAFQAQAAADAEQALADANAAQAELTEKLAAAEEALAALQAQAEEVVKAVVPEEAVTEEKAETAEEPKEEEKAETPEEPKEEEKAETAEEPKEEEKAETAEEPKEEEKAETAEEPKEEEKAETAEAPEAAGEYEQPALSPRVKSIIEKDGYQFIDLNDNGELDAYEDWRLDAETRADDLVAQMTLREKIAQMQHPTFLPRADGKFPSYLKKWCQTEGIGMLLIRELDSVETAAISMNTIQEYAEGSRLGVPVLVSMDSVHGLSYVSGATVTGHNLALAATRDLDLVTRLAEMAREEHIAIGVRMTLSPESDIASEPRWGRVMETFGEDPDLVTTMVRAQIVAFQNGEDGVNPAGIVACIKHFPGAGPQMDGKDTSPLVADEETLQIHLQPYYAAIEVNVGSVMPYYSVPLAIDMENSAIGSKAALQDLLREQMGFEGIIQTDWGMIWAIQEGLGTMAGREVSDEEAIIIGVAQSRVDGIGGESINLITQIEELVNEGKIDEDIISAAAKRIVLAKFQLGVFETPYVDVDYAVEFVGNEDHTALNLEAARKSMTLLKNDGILPLAQNEERTILVVGPRAGDMDSLVGGWSSFQDGLTIEAAIAEYAGEKTTVIYVADDLEQIAQIAKEADIVIASVGEPSYQHDPPWGYSTLEITPVQQEILDVVKEAAPETPIITVVTGGRPYILTWCDENTNAILEAYYPGQQGGIAIAETIFGLNNPTGKTPIQFPRDMQSVEAQSGDVSFDLENPLYDYGWGLSYGE